MILSKEIHIIADKTEILLINETIMKKIILIILISSLQFSYAANKNYHASIDDSKWQLTKSSPIQCVLIHKIPRYGQADFEAKASKYIDLGFKLHSKQPMPQTSIAHLKSVPPKWKPGKSSQDIGSVKFYKQFDGYVTDQNAWRILNELESGQYPTFYFKNWYNADQITSVGLSSINFSRNYDKFNDCIDNLLPYDFDDISFSILKYTSKNNSLSSLSKERLKMIGDYIKYDKNINVVLIAGHTDSYGSEIDNTALSEKRANTVKLYLAEIGLSEEQIKIRGHGEKHQIAENKTVLGRMQNRRVVISIERG